MRELKAFGIDFDSLPARRPLIRYCVDWSEQRHHLAGSLGAALATRMIDLGWVRKAERSRAVHVSDARVRRPAGAVRARAEPGLADDA